MMEERLSEAWIQEGLRPPIHNARFSDSVAPGPSSDEQAGRAPLLPEYFYFPLSCSWMDQSEGRPAGTAPLPPQGGLAGLWHQPEHIRKCTASLMAPPFSS